MRSKMIRSTYALDSSCISGRALSSIYLMRDGVCFVAFVAVWTHGDFSCPLAVHTVYLLACTLVIRCCNLCPAFDLCARRVTEGECLCAGYAGQEGENVQI